MYKNKYITKFTFASLMNLSKKSWFLFSADPPCSFSPSSLKLSDGFSFCITSDSSCSFSLSSMEISNDLSFYVRNYCISLAKKLRKEWLFVSDRILYYILNRWRLCIFTISLGKSISISLTSSRSIDTLFFPCIKCNHVRL